MQIKMRIGEFNFSRPSKRDDRTFISPLVSTLGYIAAIVQN